MFVLGVSSYQVPAVARIAYQFHSTLYCSSSMVCTLCLVAWIQVSESGMLSLVLVNMLSWDTSHLLQVGHGQGHGHADTPVFRDGVEGQYPCVRQCRLYCQDLGYSYWSMLANTVR